jgi:(2Fe-2S) ferredoxin
VVEIDGVIYGHMTVEKLKKMLKKISKEKAKK